MKNKKQIKYGAMTGFFVVLYCGIIALFINNMEEIFSNTVNNLIVISAMLILLVISAAVTGSLVFAYPAYLFINKRFREGIYAFGSNILTIIILGSIILLGIFIYY